MENEKNICHICGVKLHPEYPWGLCESCVADIETGLCPICLLKVRTQIFWMLCDECVKIKKNRIKKQEQEAVNDRFIGTTLNENFFK